LSSGFVLNPRSLVVRLFCVSKAVFSKLRKIKYFGGPFLVIINLKSLFQNSSWTILTCFVDHVTTIDLNVAIYFTKLATKVATVIATFFATNLATGRIGLDTAGLNLAICTSRQ
jgi:hypothetical protein